MTLLEGEQSQIFDSSLTGLGIMKLKYLNLRNGTGRQLLST